MVTSKKYRQEQLKSQTAGYRQLSAFGAKLFVDIMPQVKETIP
ncbi:MAG: hypothetical protein ABSE89_05890 [Sedimentisphaerales bacterium]